MQWARPAEQTDAPFVGRIAVQRFVGRIDIEGNQQTKEAVLRDVLTEDLTMAGPLKAELFVSTSGTDSDWVVKLIDVYPETYEPDVKLGGWELMVANDVSAPDAGFEVDTNRAMLFDGSGSVTETPLLSKLSLAEVILDRVAVRLGRDTTRESQ